MLKEGKDNKYFELSLVLKIKTALKVTGVGVKDHFLLLPYSFSHQSKHSVEKLAMSFVNFVIFKTKLLMLFFRAIVVNLNKLVVLPRRCRIAMEFVTFSIS